MKRYDKLVRDRIPEILEREGLRYEVRELSDATYRHALRAKVLEEAAEVAEAPEKELAKEIGDLQEVLDALITAEGLEREQIERLRAQRREERGGFEARIMIAWTAGERSTT